jgi:hypothetical protein
MVLTQLTLTFGFAMTSAFLCLLLGAYSGKRYSNATLISIIAIGTIIPLIIHFIYLQFEPSVLVLDWPLDLGTFGPLWNPLTAIWLASLSGGIFGMIAGNYWGQDDISCFRCLLGPFSLIFLLSILIIFLP